MSDLIIETAFATVLFGLVAYLIYASRSRNHLLQRGWRLIVLGFSLLFVGSLLDLTDNFDSLNSYVVIGDTPVQAVLEKIVCFLGGLLFLAFGLARWIPAVTGVEHIRKLSSELAQDVEKRRRAEDELRRAKELAEAATRSKSAFLANVSHEIRTPMTGILGFAENLLDPSLADDEKKEAAQTILHTGEYLLELLNDILDFTKIESAKLHVERIDCSPFEIIEGVCSLLKPRAKAKGLNLVHIYANGIPDKIQSDPTRIRQILMNLLGNAIKFTGRGTILLVVVFHEGSDEEPPHLAFNVLDEGIGIRSEQMNRLFEPFQQADATTTRKFGGTGLGLAISRQLTELLGGEITVHSWPSRGALFRFSIPTDRVSSVDLLEEPPESIVTSLSGGETEDDELSLNVLLAEDNVVNQKLVSGILRKVGARVTVVENGEEAMKAALKAEEDREPFDVILMDIQMPVLNGYEATRSLRKKSYARPIIALTAHAMSTDRDKCLLAGCDDYASKPIERRRLLEQIRSVTRDFESV